MVWETKNLRLHLLTPGRRIERGQIGVVVDFKMLVFQINLNGSRWNLSASLAKFDKSGMTKGN